MCCSFWIKLYVLFVVEIFTKLSSCLRALSKLYLELYTSSRYICLCCEVASTVLSVPFGPCLEVSAPVLVLGVRFVDTHPTREPIPTHTY